MLEGFNLWMILGGAVVNYIVGALWYSPRVFGRIWMEGAGLKEADVNNCGIGVYLGGFVNSVLLSFGLAAFLSFTGSHTLGDALLVAFLAWLGFVLTTHISKLLWEKTPLAVFFLNIGCSLAALLLTAAFLTVV